MYLCYKNFLMQRKIKTSKPNRRKTKARLRKKKPTIPQLKKKLWRIMSEYVRVRDSDNKGYVVCSTCDNTYYWKDPKGRSQAGHFWPKKHTPPLYYDEKNISVQCSYCNSVGEGMQYLHSQHLIKKWGQKEFDRMYKVMLEYREWKKKNPKISYKWDRAYLESMISEYTEKLKKEKLKRNIK
jgi:hypothetical protein